MRFLLVGEAPARDETKKGLHLSLAARAYETTRETLAFAKLTGDPTRALHWFVNSTVHVNLLDHWPGRDGKGSRFPKQQGRLKAQLMAGQISGHGFRFHWQGHDIPKPDLIILCGTRVRAAFGLSDRVPYFCLTASPLMPARPLFVVPHPSGVCRWWNAATHRSEARMFLELLGRAVA